MFTAGARLWDRAHPARDSFIAPLVPGNLAGWAAIHDRYGTMSWPQLFAPAIEYAEKGFAVTPGSSHYRRPCVCSARTCLHSWPGLSSPR